MISITTLISCGKSPLLMEKKSHEISSYNELSSEKKFKTSNHNLSLKWLSPINSLESAKALLIVTQHSYAADLPSPFNIFLWMPDMGHGAPPITIKKIGSGLYELSDIYFIMDGFWHIRIQLKNNDTLTEEQIFEYTLQ